MLKLKIELRKRFTKVFRAVDIPPFDFEILDPFRSPTQDTIVG